MLINIINGSQKPKSSNTEIILTELSKFIQKDNYIQNYKVDSKIFSEEIYNDILSGDIIVLGFPLFGDCLPSNTLKLLVELEKANKKKNPKEIIIYAIINNGFYEGKQTHIGFEIIKNWCGHTGMKFGGGIGQGAGEMLGETKNIPISKGPFKNLWNTLKLMAEKMSLKEPFDIIYLSPIFPRFLYSFMAKKSWHKRANKNKLKKKDIMIRL
jgi:multimeric flavodoxin WrbA